MALQSDAPVLRWSGNAPTACFLVLHVASCRAQSAAGRSRERRLSHNISGHLQVKGKRGKRRWYAFYADAEGRHQKALGPARVRDSGQRTYRGAVIWRAGHGPKPTPEHLTLDEAQAKLEAMLAQVRTDPNRRVPQRAIVTLQQARDEWLRSRSRGTATER